MKKATTKKTNEIKNGIIYIVMIGLLVAVAMFLPQIIFSIQDAYEMNHTQVQVRSNLDITQLNLTYEKDLNSRIRNFLYLKNKTATVIDYDASENSEVQELVLSIFHEQWFEPLGYNFQVIYEYINEIHYEKNLDSMISDCKKYLIHGADYQDGVALVMWYMDLDLSPLDIRIRLLVDAETNTIYYMRVTSAANQEKENTAYSGEKNQEEILYFMLNVINSCYEFFYSYYEADDVGFDIEGIDVAEYYMDSTNATAKDERVWFIDSMIQENQCEVSFYLPYGELATDFLFHAEYNNGVYADVTMGLPIIGEMIPEMIQD